MFASVMGERAKATAMPVPSSTRSVAPAARSSGKKGSCDVSAVQIASYPRLSASVAAPAALSSSNGRPPSTFISGTLWHDGDTVPLVRVRVAAAVALLLLVVVAGGAPAGAAPTVSGATTVTGPAAR